MSLHVVDAQAARESCPAVIVGVDRSALGHA